MPRGKRTICTMPLLHFTEEEFLSIGLELVGFPAPRQGAEKTKLRRFHANYGIGPAGMSACFDDLQTTLIPEARIDNPEVRLFLIAVQWLKLYLVEEKLAGDFDLTEKTVRIKVWQYVCAIQALSEEKIVWPDYEEWDEIFILSVDGVHCRVQEQRRRPDGRWVSYKLKKPAVAYEIALSIWTNACVWVRGPFKAGVQDSAIFMGEALPFEEEDAEDADDDVDDDVDDAEDNLQDLAFMINQVGLDDDEDDDDDDYSFVELEDVEMPVSLFNMVPSGKLVYGDKGYDPVPRSVVTGHNACDTEEVKQFKKRVGARHESFNKRLKSFKILDERFRHPIHKHKIVFGAVLVLVQYDMENGRPLFQL